MLVTGPNGAGKTNLLEALHVGTQGFSPRTRNDAQLVRFGASGGRVHLRGSNGGARFESEIVLAPKEGRRGKFNGAALRSADQLRGELRTLVFTPDRLAVVKGAPATRRAYLDRSLGRLHPARTALPGEYVAAVAQRNAALRRIAAGASSREALTPWTESVVTLGAALVEARREAASALAPSFEVSAAALGLADASISYDGDVVSRRGVRRTARKGPRSRADGRRPSSPRRSHRGRREGSPQLRLAGRAAGCGPRARPCRGSGARRADRHATACPPGRRSVRARRGPSPRARGAHLERRAGRRHRNRRRGATDRAGAVARRILR